jgi:hypothetical protein
MLLRETAPEALATFNSLLQDDSSGSAASQRAVEDFVRPFVLATYGGVMLVRLVTACCLHARSLCSRLIFQS